VNKKVPTLAGPPQFDQLVTLPGAGRGLLKTVPGPCRAPLPASWSIKPGTGRFDEGAVGKIGDDEVPKSFYSTTGRPDPPHRDDDDDPKSTPTRKVRFASHTGGAPDRLFMLGRPTKKCPLG